MMITRLWAAQPGEYFCVSTKPKGAGWKDTFFRRDALSRVREFVQENSHLNVYACPHGLETPSRLAEHAVPPRLLWADLDGADPRKIKYKPTIALESSPKRYVGLWCTDEETTPHLNKRLCRAVGADQSGWHYGKALRLIARTPNLKYDDPVQVRLLWTDGPVYTVCDLDSELPQLAESSAVSRRTVPIPDVDDEEGKAVARKYSIGNHYTGACGADRSLAAWALINRAIKRGCSEREAFAILLTSQAAATYEGSLKAAWEDVLRIFGKMEG